VLNSSGSIFDAGGILKQVYLPKIILPLITLFANLWKFGFIFALLLLWLWCTGSLPNVSYLALPSLLLLEFGVILAISLPLAALIPYFPDARVTVDALLRSLMLISGIFFPPEKLPPAYHFLFFLNPMAVLIDNYRRILLYDLWPSWNQLAGVGLFCLASFLFTFLFYRTIDQSVVKAIHR
jgi:lipopolysaccharide transport system permease protein